MKIHNILCELEQHFHIKAKQVASIINEPLDSLVEKNNLEAEHLKETSIKRLITLYNALHLISRKNSDPYLCRLALLQICRPTKNSPAQSFINALLTTPNPGEKLILLAQEGMNIQISKPRK